MRNLILLAILLLSITARAGITNILDTIQCTNLYMMGHGIGTTNTVLAFKPAHSLGNGERMDFTSYGILTNVSGTIFFDLNGFNISPGISLFGDMHVSGVYYGDGFGLSNVVAAAVSGVLTNPVYYTNIIGAASSTNYSFIFTDTVTSNAVVMSFNNGQIIYNATGTNAPAAPVTLALLDIATSKPVTISFANGQITYNAQ